MAAISGQLYSPEEYLAKLEGDDPSQAGDHSFVGLIKPADTTESLLYAHPADCTNWVEIGLDLIQSIEHFGRRTCGDHSHPLARLSFVAPDTPAQNTFLSLARLHHDVAITQPALPAFVDNGCPPGQHPCYDSGMKIWTCCSD